MSRAAAILVAAQVAWAAAGFVFPDLPGWTMFSKARRVPPALAWIYAYVPRDVYVIDEDGAKAVAAFACRTHPERACAP